MGITKASLAQLRKLIKRRDHPRRRLYKKKVRKPIAIMQAPAPAPLPLRYMDPGLPGLVSNLELPVIMEIMKRHSVSYKLAQLVYLQLKLNRPVVGCKAAEARKLTGALGADLRRRILPETES
jgi:hypothetical protein